MWGESIETVPEITDGINRKEVSNSSYNYIPYNQECRRKHKHIERNESTKKTQPKLPRVKKNEMSAIENALVEVIAHWKLKKKRSVNLKKHQ